MHDVQQKLGEAWQIRRRGATRIFPCIQSFTVGVKKNVTPARAVDEVSAAPVEPLVTNIKPIRNLP